MYHGIPIGLVFLNFIGMVLLVMAVVVGIKLIIRGARGYPSRGYPGRGSWARGNGGPWRHGPAFGWRGYGDWSGGCGQDRQPDHQHGYKHGRKHGGRHGGRHGGGQGGRHERRDQALDHANLRLARGEINTEQYLELRSALTKPAGNGSGDGAGSAASRGHGGGRRVGSATAIARLRLASGEIGVEEYQALRAALEA